MALRRGRDLVGGGKDALGETAGCLDAQEPPGGCGAGQAGCLNETGDELPLLSELAETGGGGGAVGFLGDKCRTCAVAAVGEMGLFVCIRLVHGLRAGDLSPAALVSSAFRRAEGQSCALGNEGPERVGAGVSLRKPASEN